LVLLVQQKCKYIYLKFILIFNYYCNNIIIFCSLFYILYFSFFNTNNIKLLLFNYFKIISGSIDKLDILADIAKKYGALFHVDGAWGGSFIMSNKYRHLLKGIEKADTITIDDKYNNEYNNKYNYY